MDKYDVGIIGAGIAGACLAISLAKAGKKVVVFEQKAYPAHKVCGEFLSLESVPYLKSLGLPIEDWNLPVIKQLKLTNENGYTYTRSLKLGGTGLSRYKLDFELSKLFEKNGVAFYPETKVTKVETDTISASGIEVKANLIVGSHGKYVAGYLKEPVDKPAKKYVGVKYHIKGNFNAKEIALHSFNGGYCGISQVEDETFCLCYLVSADQLKKHGMIEQLERNVLYKNPYLQQIYHIAEFLWDKPLTISNIRFDKQYVSRANTLFVGDAVGSISPLSGNGMSIAASSAYLLADIILNNDNVQQIKALYNEQWDKQFGSRVGRAKLLNRIMLNPASHLWTLRLFNRLPYVADRVINAMQGKPFG
jgi:flavin-dependent dehydrogenase